MRIENRHELLKAAIGVHTEEQEAYNLALLLIWLPALIITLASILDFSFYLLYNRFGHPWKHLLQKDENIVIETKDENDVLESNWVYILPVYKRQNGELISQT